MSGHHAPHQQRHVANELWLNMQGTLHKFCKLSSLGQVCYDPLSGASATAWCCRSGTGFPAVVPVQEAQAAQPVVQGPGVGQGPF